MVTPEVVYHDSTRGLISKIVVRKILGGLSRPCFIRDYKCLQLGNHSHYSWSEIKKLYAIRLFLQARNGVHGRNQYSKLLEKYKPEEILDFLGIDLNTKFTELRNEWNYKI